MHSDQGRDLLGEILGRALQRQAPTGERAVYVNPAEELALLGLGGSGQITPTGIPSYQEIDFTAAMADALPDDFEPATINPVAEQLEQSRRDEVAALMAGFTPSTSGLQFASLAPIDRDRAREIEAAAARAAEKEETLLGQILPGRYSAEYDPYSGTLSEDPKNVITPTDLATTLLGLFTNPIIGGAASQIFRDRETMPNLQITGQKSFLDTLFGSPDIDPSEEEQRLVEATEAIEISEDNRQQALAEALLAGQAPPVLAGVAPLPTYYTPPEEIQRRIRENLAFGRQATGV